MGIFDTLANTFGAPRRDGSTLAGSDVVPEGVEQYSRMQGVLSTLDQIVKSNGNTNAHVKGQQCRPTRKNNNNHNKENNDKNFNTFSFGNLN